MRKEDFSFSLFGDGCGLVARQSQSVVSQACLNSATKRTISIRSKLLTQTNSIRDLLMTLFTVMSSMMPLMLEARTNIRRTSTSSRPSFGRDVTSLSYSLVSLHFLTTLSTSSSIYSTPQHPFLTRMRTMFLLQENALSTAV